MFRTSQNEILNGSIVKAILFFFFPILIGSFFQQIYSTVDAIIVGQFVGVDALAAVGGTPAVLSNLFIQFALGIASGASVVISNAYGENNHDKMSKAIHSGMTLSIILGIGISGITIIFAKDILMLLKVNDELMKVSLQYFQIIMAGFTFTLIYNMATGVLRAVGDTKRPLYFLIISCILNIILDIIFVLVFKLAIVGVAVATIISQAISAILTIYCLTNSNTMYHLDLRKLRLDKHITLSIIKIGLPAGLQSVMYSLSNLIIQRSINLLGTNYVAAWSAYSKIDPIFWNMIGAFGVSMTTFSAQNYGARNYQRIKKGVTITMIITAICSILLSVCMYQFASYIYLLFTTDVNVILIGVDILKFLVPFYIVFIPIEILAAALRGVNDAIVPVVITGVGVCLLRVVWILAVANKIGDMKSILMCYPITWITTSILFFIYYYIYKAMDKRITD